jgi:predicted O-methyltransferase YrrM
VDGQKRQYGEYLERLWPFLRKWSQIILDDVIKFQSKLDSLYTFLSQKQIEYTILQLEQDDGVMVIVKE